MYAFKVIVRGRVKENKKEERSKTGIRFYTLSRNQFKYSWLKSGRDSTFRQWPYG